MFLRIYSRFLPDSLGINAQRSMILSVKFSEEWGPSHVMRFPGWFFLLLNSSKFSFYWMWHHSKAPSAAATMKGIVSVFTFPSSWVFQPFVFFFGCLVFFSAGTDTSISLYHFIPQDDIRFVGWYSSVGVDLCWSYRTVHVPAVVSVTVVPFLS